MDPADGRYLDSLVNEAEQLVIREIRRQVAGVPGVCTCDECMLDMAAYALNKVRPRYRVSLLDTVFADRKERGAYQQEIEEAVAEAIQVVKAHPSHD
ncbi:MAG: late competence development ComFB family protein [Spirochaetales bacterium]|nr:late competence development ComFB family protein [Spirochaetales bacterium]